MEETNRLRLDKEFMDVVMAADITKERIKKQEWDRYRILYVMEDAELIDILGIGNEVNGETE